MRFISTELAPSTESWFGIALSSNPLNKPSVSSHRSKTGNFGVITLSTLAHSNCDWICKFSPGSNFGMVQEIVRCISFQSPPFLDIATVSPMTSGGTTMIIDVLVRGCSFPGFARIRSVTRHWFAAFCTLFLSSWEGKCDHRISSTQSLWLHSSSSQTKGHTTRNLPKASALTEMNKCRSRWATLINLCLARVFWKSGRRQPACRVRSLK